MWTRERVVAHYCDRMGFEVTPRWRFYEVFGLFRLAVIAQQIWYRYFHGQTTNEEFAVFGPAVGYLESRCRVAPERLMGQILLVRHGQASFGAADYDVLSATGWDAGASAGRRARRQGVRPPPTSIVRGDIRRHRETRGGRWPRPPGGTFSATIVDPKGEDELDRVGLVAASPDLPQGMASGEVDRRTFQRVFETATAPVDPPASPATTRRPTPRSSTRVRGPRWTDACGQGRLGSDP